MTTEETAPAPSRERLEAELQRLEDHSRRLLQRLSEGERRFRGIARSSWRIQEEERRNLARELHDGLGQSLTAVKTRLEWLAQRPGMDSELESELRELARLTAQSLAETRELSRLLRPAILDDLGLESALRWLARSLSRSGEGATARLRDGETVAAPSRSLEVRSVVQGLEERLEEDIETLLFRIAQEAATNAVKHARASEISIRLQAREEQLILSVDDDGVGFDPAAEPAEDAGVGIRGMRDRVAIFGGRLSIESTPGAGTRVRLELPVD